MPRRPYRSGSIVKRGKGWRARIEIAPDPKTGNRRTRSRTVRTRAEAQTLIDRWRADTPDDPATNATVAQLIVSWWPDVSGRLKQRTRADWQSCIDRFITPNPIARRRLRDLRGPHVTRWHYDLAEAGVTPDVVLRCHTILSSALTWAGKMGWVNEHRNAARLAGRPGVDRPKRDAPENDVVIALLDACGSDEERVWIRLAAVTGARRSELLGLRWTDVVLHADGRGELVIERQVVAVPGGGWAFDSTKTGQRRTVPLERGTVGELLALRGVQEARCPGLSLDAFVLPGSLDGAAPVLPGQASKNFRRLARRAGLPDSLHLHDLRHRVGSLVVAEVGAPAASKRLGHSSTKLTLDTYTSSLSVDDWRAAEVVDRALERRT